MRYRPKHKACRKHKFPYVAGLITSNFGPEVVPKYCSVCGFKDYTIYSSTPVSEETMKVLLDNARKRDMLQ